MPNIIKDQELREEWKEAINNKQMFIKDTINETANWWITKLNSNCSQLLQEIEESLELGGDVIDLEGELRPHGREKFLTIINSFK